MPAFDEDTFPNINGSYVGFIIRVPGGFRALIGVPLDRHEEHSPIQVIVRTEIMATAAQTHAWFGRGITVYATPIAAKREYVLSDIVNPKG